MKLSKIDLSNIVAVGHCEGYLGLLIDRGEEVEYIEIPATNDTKGITGLTFFIGLNSFSNQALSIKKVLL